MSNYQTDNEVTLDYIKSLIVRCGFTDVSDQYPSEAVAYQDLNGVVFLTQHLANLRDQLILQYLIQQNS